MHQPSPSEPTITPSTPGTAPPQVLRGGGVRRRLALTFGVTLLVVSAAMTMMSLFFLGRVESQVDRLEREGTRATAAIAQAAIDFGDHRDAMRSLLVNGRTQELVSRDSRLRGAIDASLDNAAAYSASPVLRAQIAEVKANLREANAKADKVIAQRRAGAVTVNRSSQERLDPVFDDFSAKFAALTQAQWTNTAAIVAEAHDANDRSRLLLIALGAFSALLVVITALLVALRLSRRIERVAVAVGHLADGDLDARVEDRHADEIGSIARSVNAMAERMRDLLDVERNHGAQLQQTIEAVEGFADRVAAGDLTARLEVDSGTLAGLAANLNRMVAGLSEISVEVQQGSYELSSSAAQILQTVSRYQSSSTEQAASVSQTSVTINEIRANSEQVAGRAKGLAEQAKRAATISDEGGRAVSQLLDGMDQIGERVDAIALDIRELALRSEAIGQINQSVSDLAEQSNMLALNATIEAARAGEQGRGFAVVADEVRNLAEQSKQATLQVQAILHEIRNAASKAVSAADEGSRVVAGGRDQATETGHVIRQLGEAVRQTANVAAQIAAGSREQAIGMDQIGQAMIDLNHVTDEIASGAVDSERAAGALNALADRLTHTTRRYRLQQ